MRKDYLKNDKDDRKEQAFCRTEEVRHNQNVVPEPRRTLDQYAFLKKEYQTVRCPDRQSYAVSPLKEEPYHVHLLLHHLRKAAFYEHIETVEEEQCAIVKGVYISRWWLTDDEGCKNALREGFRLKFTVRTVLPVAIIVHYLASRTKADLRQKSQQ